MLVWKLHTELHKTFYVCPYNQNTTVRRFNFCMISWSWTDVTEQMPWVNMRFWFKTACLRCGQLSVCEEATQRLPDSMIMWSEFCMSLWMQRTRDEKQKLSSLFPCRFRFHMIEELKNLSVSVLCSSVLGLVLLGQLISFPASQTATATVKSQFLIY